MGDEDGEMKRVKHECVQLFPRRSLKLDRLQGAQLARSTKGRRTGGLTGQGLDGNIQRAWVRGGRGVPSRRTC